MGKLLIVNGVKIHDTAEVHSKSDIGEGTIIWNNVQIRESSKIGKNCIIGKDVYIDVGVTLGDNVKVQNGVSIYKGVTVESDVFLGPHIAFTNDMHPRAFNKDWVIVPTLVKRGASIGANATIICGTIINSYSMVGAGSVVTKNVPDHGLVIGNPAKLVGFVCKCGSKLKNKKNIGDLLFFSCQKCKEVVHVKSV